MTDTERAIQALRAIETERELTEKEEARLVGLLKCKAEDDAARSTRIRKRLSEFYARGL